MSIKIDKVSKFYSTQKALDEISFEIHSGQIVGFIGPNGAGKTTTMRIITTYIRPDAGKVYVNDLDITKQAKDVKYQIGYLPENNPLYYEMYVKDFLTFIARIYKLNHIEKQVERVIEMTGLTPEKHKKISQLSKGFKQRVGLAQAIIHNPSVLILDEPTSGLDPNQIIEIRNLIKRLGEEKTVLLSTHIMQEVEAICDKVIIINKGKIVANDTPEQINKTVTNQMRRYIVEFDKDIARSELETIVGVEEVHYLKHRRWLIMSFDDVRKEVFNFAVQSNITILAMEEKRMSLEEIFRELTNEN